MTKDTEISLHASAVALDGRAMLFFGPSGTGKSTYALAMMAQGCRLIADDTTLLRREGTRLMAAAHPETRGRIEARGIGILAAKTAPPAPVDWVVDLERTETARLPERHVFERLDISVPCIYRVDGQHFVPALLQLLKAGRAHP